MFDYQKIINKKIPAVMALVAIGLVFVLGLFIGASSSGPVIKGIDVTEVKTPGQLENANSEIPEYLTRDVDFNLFWDVWNLVKDQYYYTDIPETQLFYGALAGVVASLGDPYSMFLTPKNNEDFQEDLKGEFEGIGAEIGIKNNRLTIISPLPDSPAISAGLRSGDIILFIDDYDTAGITLNKAVGLIRGKRGTQVVLTVYREDAKEPKEITVARDTINVKSLTWDFIGNGDIAYIKVRQFNGETVSLFNSAIIDIVAKDIKGIVLDLRNNPGGYLQSAITMSSEWVNGKVIVTEKLRSGEKVDHQVNHPARLEGYKTVILVNEGSASGSEIVAGALKDWNKATILGKKTFGKGSVQTVNNLKDGSALKLTIAKWFTPKGTSIEDEGIMPDVEVELTEDDYNNNQDPQLDQAISIINSQ